MSRGKHRRKRIKGSSVIIAAMYVLWIWYIYVQVRCYAEYCTFLPAEMTYSTAACFIVETIALARLKLAKEGYVLPKKKSNQFLKRIGIDEESELEELAQEISETNKEADHV